MPCIYWSAGFGVGGAVAAAVGLYYGVFKPTLALKMAELESWQEKEFAKLRRDFDAAVLKARR